MTRIIKRVFIPFALCGFFLFGETPTCTAGGKKLDPKATRDYVVAYGMQSKQLYEQAAKRWQKFLDAYPKDPRRPNAFLYLGACQLQRKQFDDAVKSFQTVLNEFASFKNRDVAHFNLALTYYNRGLAAKDKGELKKAAETFEDVVQKYRKSKYAAFARYYQGESLFASGDLKGAVQAYAQFSKEFNQSSLLADVMYALGTTQQELGDHGGAKNTFEQFVEKFKNEPRRDECRLRLGQSLVQLKQHEKAEAIFSDLADVDDFAFADYALMQFADCRYAQKKLEDAARNYERVASKFPKSKYRFNAWLLAGKTWYEIGNFNKARTVLARVTGEKVAEAPEAFYWLGQAYLELKQPQQALQQMEQALAKISKSDMRPKLQLTRIQALFDIPDRRKDSIKLFADFAAKNPKNELAAKAQYMAALGAMKDGDYESAQKYATAFLERDDWAKDELAAEALLVAGESFLHAKKPEYKTAEKYFEQLLREHPKHAQVNVAKLRLGLCYYSAKKHDDSVKLLQEAAPKFVDGELKAEAYLLLGRNFSDLGKTDEARNALQQALQARNDWKRGDEVLLPLALALRKQKNFDDAIKYLDRLNQRFPKSELRPQALYELGDLWTVKKDFNKARTFFEQTFAQFPKTELAPLAQYRIGANWFAQENYGEAIRSLSKLVSAYPKSKLVHKSRYMRGLSYQRTKKYEPAIKDLAAFLATKSDAMRTAHARYALGLSQVGTKKFGDAVATFRELLKESPKFEHVDTALYETAFALLETKKPDEARAAFEDLATKYPKSELAAESWFRVGELYEKEKQLPLAAKAYAGGLNLASTDDLKAKLHYKLGWIPYRQERFKEAAVEFAKMVKAHPKHELVVDANYLAGECYFKQNQFKQALAHFVKTIAQNSKKYQERALYRSGNCAANLAQWAESEKHYDKLVNDHPKFEFIHEARYGLAWAMQNQSKFKEAVPHYEQIIKETDAVTAAKSRFMIGEIAFAKKEYKKAIEHFLETALGYPFKKWQADSYVETARCYLELKDKKTAREYLQTVLDKYADQRSAVKIAKKLLTDLDG